MTTWARCGTSLLGIAGLSVAAHAASAAAPSAIWAHHIGASLAGVPGIRQIPPGLV
jgi:hypothetical protein